VTDGQHGEERDPLLVRPYVRDPDPAAAEHSAQTWPSATTREVRSQSALEGADDPTAILHLPSGPGGRGKRRRPAWLGGTAWPVRRLVVVLAACFVMLLGAAAAGIAALRNEGGPSGPAALREAPIPALTGLVPASPAALPSSAGATVAGAATSGGATSSDSPAVSAADSSVSAGASGLPGAGTTSVGGTAPGSTAPGSTAPGSTAPGSTAPAEAGKTAPAALAPEITARTGTIRGQNGLCLDLNGAVAADFNHVQVYVCNDTVAQAWTLAADGTLRVMGLCALVVGDDTVHVTSCDTRTTERWAVSGQLLVNAADGKCLTDPSGGAASGTGATVTACGGGANQRWSLP
jgi:hypothetical protein